MTVREGSTTSVAAYCRNEKEADRLWEILKAIAKASYGGEAEE